MRSIIFLATLTLLLQGCDERRVYEDSLDFRDRTWKVNDTARFEFTIKDSAQRYNLYINIRNSLDYPYARLFVHYALQDSARRPLSQKLVSQFLFDQRTGEPRGKSGLGDVFDHQFLLLPNQQFKIPGRYRVELEQFMRTDTLAGVLAVGVRVETTKPKE